LHTQNKTTNLSLNVGRVDQNLNWLH